MTHSTKCNLWWLAKLRAFDNTPERCQAALQRPLTDWNICTCPVQVLVELLRTVAARPFVCDAISVTRGGPL